MPKFLAFIGPNPLPISATKTSRALKSFKTTKPPIASFTSSIDAFLNGFVMTAADQASSGCIIGRDYPAPLVDHAQAAAKAKAEIQAIRSPKVKAFESDLNLPSGDS
ncbi:MAG: hypothetical protein AAGD96_10410 [Chloroflexota bacterium]